MKINKLLKIKKFNKNLLELRNKPFLLLQMFKRLKASHLKAIQK